MPRLHTWDFPLPRTHTGILQGNAILGTMIWGGGNHLRITLGRADFWDHRGGLAWTTKQSYANIRRCLEAGDEKGLRALFEDTGPAPGQPPRPTILPVGRFDLDLGRGARLTTGTLNLDDGTVTVHVRKAGREHTVRILLDMTSPVVALRFSPGFAPAAVVAVPAWEYVGEQLKAVSFEPPETFRNDSGCGWIQTRPADPPLCAASHWYRRALFLTAVIGTDENDAVDAADRAMRTVALAGLPQLETRNRGWWQDYWRQVAATEIPNADLQFLYDYGMYKFAGLTQPRGVAATLQGAWIEEYQLPPWSSDYHFNINVQMCYWPAYHGNCVEHLRPLFELIRGWLPVLRHNAKVFLGIDDGLMLPHAVDDRCVCMGGFWTGSIDHGCTAWVAQMMFRYYRYTLDRKFLRETAFPFMKGAMRVYEEMLERDGDRFVLPVSVSPEYRGATMNAWGRNASFQLACIHRLCADLLEAAVVLKEKPRPVWRQIREKLPLASFQGPAGSEQIGLWDGTPLEESHRHHSHLAGITPFDVVSPQAPALRPIVERSIAHWIKQGAGLWSGWCVPWASMLHTRMGNADAAELWLEIWRRLFTNAGHGTLHDVDFAGFSLMGKGATCSGEMRGEIMQIEAGMSCVAAIQEMLLHVHDGVTVLFKGAPARWKRVGFKGMRTDGAFLVSARRLNGRVGAVRVESLAGGVFRLANPWSGQGATARSATGTTRQLTGATLELRLARGEIIQLSPAGKR